MSTTILAESDVQTISVIKEIEIGAPLDIAFEAMLEELGPNSVMPDGKAFPMVIEAWPGGRWFRDLGNNTGHLWGHVQVIKPPMLLELCGPMFMSYPVHNHVQYRLTADGEGTRLTLTHQAFGPIPPEVNENLGKGWDFILKRVRECAERRKGQH